MTREVYITESQSRMLESVLAEEEEEITFYSFVKGIKEFLGQLLTNPTNPELPSFFSDKGLTKSELLNKLVSNGIAIEKNKVIDDDGSAKLSMKYSIPKAGFREKVEKLYDEIICKKQINEDEGGAAVGGEGASAGEGGCFLSSGADTAKSAQGSGQYISPAFLGKNGKKSDVIRRKYV